MVDRNQCQFYCTATGPWTKTECLHCDVVYCHACLYGSKGHMMATSKSGNKVMRCPGCRKNPKVKKRAERNEWTGADGRNSGKKIHGQPHIAPVGPNRRQQQEASLGPNGILLNLLRTESPTHSRSPSPKSPKSPTNGQSPYRSSPNHGSVFGRLTDPALYPATHKHRFDEQGWGRGMEGRRDDIEGVPPRSDSLAAGLRKRPPKADQGLDISKDPDAIVARLTDPAGFTGTHKQRFDKDGYGRGIAGRRDDTQFQVASAGQGVITRDFTPEMDTPNGPVSALEPAHIPISKAPPNASSNDAYTDKVMISGVYKRLLEPKIKQHATEYDVAVATMKQFSVRGGDTEAILHGTARREGGSTVSVSRTRRQLPTPRVKVTTPSNNHTNGHTTTTTTTTMVN